MRSTCWPFDLHFAVHFTPNHLDWVQVQELWRPGHLAQHSVTLLLVHISLTTPGGVFGISQDTLVADMVLLDDAKNPSETV